MNLIILTGRLTADPEVRTTQTGKKVAKFSIAVNEGKDKSGNERVQFFNISAWENQADTLEKWAKKGTKIMVEGRLENRSWDKPDGTKGYATDILLNRFEFLGSKSDSEGAAGGQSDFQQRSAPIPVKNSRKNDEIDLNEKLPEINIDDMNVQMPF